MSDGIVAGLLSPDCTAMSFRVALPGGGTVTLSLDAPDGVVALAATDAAFVDYLVDRMRNHADSADNDPEPIVVGDWVSDGSRSMFSHPYPVLAVVEHNGEPWLVLPSDAGGVFGDPASYWTRVEVEQ